MAQPRVAYRSAILEVMSPHLLRRLAAPALAAVLLCTGCTSGDTDGGLKPDPGTKDDAITFATAKVDWAPADGEIDFGTRPEAPEGFDDEMVAEMEDALTSWATVAALDERTWHSDDAQSLVADALPGPVGSALKDQQDGAVSPDLGVANVFGPDVEVLGAPRVSVAWALSTPEDDDGRQYVDVQLQTRAAYEVRRDGGPTRVIGVLRVHGLSAYPDTTDDFGLTGGWQEFGAADCVLALDDHLSPDSDVTDARTDLETFARIGAGTELEMPELPTEELVDAEYLKRCRNGTT
jgi:hypothetical protein